ncbi:MAG: hypothetical protein QXP01_09630, partial [Candidatus Hadarchaeum sp.]
MATSFFELIQGYPQVSLFGTSAPQSPTKPYVLWHGYIPHKIGLHFSPWIYSADTVKNLLQGDGAKNLIRYRTGLSQSDVIGTFMLYGEADWGTKQEQSNRI